MRDRLVGLIGRGRLATTTRGFDEASSRVSRYLLMQSPRQLHVGLPRLRRDVSVCTSRTPSSSRPSAARCGSSRMSARSMGAGAPVLVSLAAMPAGLVPLTVLRLLRRPRAVHEHRARDRAVCRGGRRLAGGPARVGGVLDLAVGAARPADGLAADGLPGGDRQVRARPGVRRHADGRHAAAGAGAGYYQRLLARDQGEAAELVEKHITSGLDRIGFRRHDVAGTRGMRSAIASRSGCRPRRRPRSSTPPANCICRRRGRASSGGERSGSRPRSGSPAARTAACWAMR